MSNPLSPGIERRGHPRLALNLVCHLHARTPAHWKASGRTINISRSGVLLRLESPAGGASAPPLGSQLCVDIELPTRRLLRCHGRVVRLTDSHREGALLAIAIRRMEFREHARKPVGLVQRARWSDVRELLM